MKVYQVWAPGQSGAISIHATESGAARYIEGQRELRSQLLRDNPGIKVWYQDLQIDCAEIAPFCACGDEIVPGTMNAAGCALTADGWSCGICESTRGAPDTKNLNRLSAMRRFILRSRAFVVRERKHAAELDRLKREISSLQRRMESRPPWAVSTLSDDELHALRMRWSFGPEKYQADMDSIIGHATWFRDECETWRLKVESVLRDGFAQHGRQTLRALLNRPRNSHRPE